MVALRQIVETLSTDDCIQIIEDYNQFEEQGFIGECMLRELAKKLGGGNASITIWSHLLVSEVWRRFCIEYFIQKGMIE